MKSLKKQTQENPKKTIVTVITALIGFATLFIEQSEILEIDTAIVKWVSFGISGLTLLLSFLNSNLNKYRK